MKHLMKKSISMIMVMIMILAMTMSPAFAAGSIITQISTTQYTTFMNLSNPVVPLFATTTSNYMDNQPFDSTGTYDIEWGWTEDGTTIVGGSSTGDGQLSFADLGLVPTSVATAFGVTPDIAPTGGGDSYALAMVYFSDLNIQPAVYSLVVKMGTSSANYTIAVQSDDEQPEVTVDVKIVDSTNNDELLVDEANVDVKRSEADTGFVLYGKSDALQNNPSAMGVLDALTGITTSPEQFDSFTVNAAGSYTDTLTIDSAPYSPTGAPSYYGWMYGVYRDNGTQYELVEISSVVSASAFPIEDNDKILWVYGSYSPLPNLWP